MTGKKRTQLALTRAASSLRRDSLLREAATAGRALLLGQRLRAQTPLDVHLQGAEEVLVPADGVMKRVQQPLGRVEVHHQPVRHLDGHGRQLPHLWVEAE